MVNNIIKVALSSFKGFFYNCVQKKNDLSSPFCSFHTHCTGRIVSYSLILLSISPLKMSKLLSDQVQKGCNSYPTVCSIEISNIFLLARLTISQDASMVVEKVDIFYLSVLNFSPSFSMEESSNGTVSSKRQQQQKTRSFLVDIEILSVSKYNRKMS